MVEIAKALSLDKRIEGDIVILLDEPTSVLEKREVELLFSIVRELKARAAIVFISHRLDEVLDVSDRIYVHARRRCVVHEVPAEAASQGSRPARAHGRPSAASRVLPRGVGSATTSARWCCRFAISDRRGPFPRHLVRAPPGEILGIAGVVGSGREELARCLAGLAPRRFRRRDPLRAGRRGQAVQSRGSAVAAGIGFVPSERKIEGIGRRPLSVAENMTLAADRRSSRRNGFIRFERERRTGGETLDRPAEHQAHRRRDRRREPVGRQPAEGGSVKVANRRVRASPFSIIRPGVDVGAKEDVYETDPRHGGGGHR